MTEPLKGMRVDRRKQETHLHASANGVRVKVLEHVS